MDYFARLVRQSQLSIGTGGPAPPAGTMHGFHEEDAPADVVEIDATREHHPEMTVAAAPPRGTPLPPDLSGPPAPSLSQPPPGARQESDPPPARMPADDIQSSHPGHPAPAAKTDAADPRAAPTRVLREVIEWIAAGSQAVPVPELKPQPAPATNSPIPASIEPPEERTLNVREEIETSDVVPAAAAPSSVPRRAPAPAARHVLAKPVPVPTRMDADDTPLRAASWTLARAQPLSVEPVAELQETFEVSIGNLSLHIEAPARPVPTPPAPVAAAAPPPANADGRLQRRYLRP